MKKNLLLLLACFGFLTAFAQTKNIAITGKVIEADTKEAVIQATVQLLSLPDSTFVTGASTLGKGTFTLPKVAAGRYVLQVTYVGFLAHKTPLQLKAGVANVNVGTIALEANSVLLEEAVVVAEAPPVVIRADTTEFNASAYRVAEGSMLEELVKKLPGAEVSEDGTITVNGKEIKKIMVDGKEFFSDDPKVAMKNLPVNMVEKVKTYDKKSDMARITGIDDGDEETVLDLTVKKGMKQGWIGNVIAGYGNKDRYEASGMASRFLDDSSLTFIGSLNNTNNTGMSEFGDSGQGRGGGAGTGITTSKSVGLNFAKETTKFQLGGNVQYGYSDNDAQSSSSSERFLGEESSFGNAINANRRKRHDVRGDFRLEWRLDTLTTIIFRPTVSYSKTNSLSESWSDTRDNSYNLVNDKSSFSSSKSDNLSLSGRLEAYRKLSDNGRNISLRANFGYSDGETNSESDTETNYADVDVEDTKMERTTDRNSDSRNWSVSASYTEPVFTNHFLQARYEFAHRKRLSESLVADQDSIDVMPNGYVESLSSRVENFYDTHSIELSIRGVHPKMMYNAGVTLIPQSSRSETTIGPNASKQLPTQNVLNFAPSIMFRYMWSRQQILMLHYRGRSSEPDIENLQEVIDQTDPLNIRYGNPNLKPSFSHNVRLMYNKSIPETMRSYSLHVNFSATQNSVANKMTYDPTTGGTISRKVNVNGNWQGRAFFSFNTPFKNKKYTLSANSNANFSDAVSYTSISNTGEESQESELSTTHNMALGQRLTGSYRTDLFDVSINGGISYNKANNSKQTNSNRETFDYTYGASTNINLPWSMALSTDLSCRVKHGYSGNYDPNEVIWNAQISKNFLKNKSATLRLKVYDILKEQSNLTRSISETMISDTEYNTLGSYVMVHFVYRFNTLGGKAARQTRGFGPGGGGGRGYGPPPGGGRF